MSSSVFSHSSIEKQYQQYLIKLSSDLDLIYIIIEKDHIIYESNFNLEYFHQYKLLISSFTSNDIIELIKGLIDINKIEIKEENMNLKLILISPLPNHSNVELNLQKKNTISNEIIEILFEELENLKKENKKLKDSIGILNERIEKIEENNQNKIKKMENRIENLEKLHLLKDENKQLKICNLKNINIIHSHKDWINSVSIFPSGNIISTSNDKSIIIYDIHFNILQNIQNAHDNSINYVEIKDENNFVSCSYDKSIKLWIKNNNEFKINKIIKNAHNDSIRKVIYCSNRNLISCSYDKTIKIWKENKSDYENIQILNHSDWINSLLFLEDKNILISSGLDGTRLWNYNEIKKINLIKEFKETYCGWNQGLCRLNNDIIIIKDKETTSLKLISISKKEIIKTIYNPFHCCAITLIKNKGIFLVVGVSKDIRIYRNDNFECIQEIKDAHNDNILGVIELKDGSIASFSNDQTIKIWSF